MLCLFPPPLRGTARRAGEGRSCGRGFSPELLLSPLPLRATVRRAEKGALTHPAKQSARPPEQIAWHVQFPNSTRRAKCSDRKAICLARKANNPAPRANDPGLGANRSDRRVPCSRLRVSCTEVRAMSSQSRGDFFAGGNPYKAGQGPRYMAGSDCRCRQRSCASPRRMLLARHPGVRRDDEHVTGTIASTASATTSPPRPRCPPAPAPACPLR